MTVNIYRVICAIIEAKDGPNFKARVDDDCVNEHIPKLLEYNTDQASCVHEFHVGDQIKIYVSDKNYVVDKVEPWMPLTTIYGTMKHSEKAYGLIYADDHDLDVLYLKDGDNESQFSVGDQIKCDCIEGIYEMNSISYPLRAVRLQLRAKRSDRIDIAAVSDKSNEHNEAALPEQHLKNMKIKSILGDFLESLNSPENNNNETVTDEIRLSSRSNLIFKDYPYQTDNQNELYLLPNDLYNIFKVDKIVEQMAKKLHTLFPKTIETKESYAIRFHNLIYLEELEMKHAFKYYKSENVRFEVLKKNKFALRCAIIPELRPPISVGDLIHAYKDNSSLYYRGIVERISDEYFTIKFADGFIRSFNVNDNFNVEFHYNRLIYKRKHQGVDRAVQKFSEQFVFPTKLTTTEPQLNVISDTNESITINEKPLNFFMKTLNDEQKEAVKHVLRGECRPLPYIIYGPPGTGKTYVLIEIIQQLLHHSPNSKILIATQSNAAANIIAARLVEENTDIADTMLRLISKSMVDKKKLPMNLRKYSASIQRKEVDDIEPDDNDLENDHHRITIKLEELNNFRVIIGTCVGLGILAESDMNDGHFTHVLLDEAAQCIEPEAMIPISLLNPKHGQIIMAGDPMQLSPIVLSVHGKQHGLSQSMLERYLNRYSQWDNHTSESYDQRLVTKLRWNYRTLPCILEFYNTQFYDSTLIPFLHQRQSHLAKLLAMWQNCKALPSFNYGNSRPPFGAYFINVAGTNIRLKNKKSWRNQEEKDMICIIVTHMLSNFVSPEEIGIITPYHAQALYLKQALADKNIAIGTVEEFQGEEKTIILISAVKTHGNKHALNFVLCPKRFNTAISRARAAVIVLGCANLFSNDPKWLAYINYCKDAGSYMSEEMMSDV